jgi:hypothetical protein
MLNLEFKLQLSYNLQSSFKHKPLRETEIDAVTFFYSCILHLIIYVAIAYCAVAYQATATSAGVKHS